MLIVVALAVAGLSGWVHGRITDRWGPPSNVLAVAKQVEDLTLDIDGWQSEPSGKIDDATRKLAGAEGYFSRRYVHEKTGAEAHVTILCGRPGPISLHSPIYCFTLSGMTQLGKEAPIQLGAAATGPGGDSQSASETSFAFLTADYRPPESRGGPDIRTFWSWSPDGQTWSAPEDARLTFAREPYLYRLYFTAPVRLFERTAEADEEDAENAAANPVDEFMREFLIRFAQVSKNFDTE